MIYSTKRKTLILIGLVTIVTVIIATGLSQLELQPGIPPLLLTFYASKQHTSTKYVLYDALQKRELPLPEHIHTFLFQAQPEESKWPLNKLLHSILTACASYFVHPLWFIGKNFIISIHMIKKKYKSIVFLTDLGLYSSKARSGIAGSYKNAR